MLEVAIIFVMAVVAGWFGVEFETVEAIVGVAIAAVVLWIVVRSAYRDAFRRRRWLGKSLGKSQHPADGHSSAASSPSATNR